ncbi:MAG: polysaccharide biosynthesis/export family protein [Paracoccaceae bacterium]
MRRLIGSLVTTLFLAACTQGFTEFPISEERQADLPPNVVVTRLDANNVGSFSQQRRVPGSQTVPDSQVWNYQIGVGDILSIDVFDHPELTLPAGPMRSAAESGFRVQADGSFFYPFVGQVQAAGRAPEQIREELQTRLAEFIPDPQLEVRVAAFNSQAIVVTGEVDTPNRQSLTNVPLTLLEAVNAAGGLTPEADAARVTLQRRGRTYNINFNTFLQGGRLTNNPILINGDTISVPRRRIMDAFVLGQIVAPATIDLSEEDISLTQAVTRQGGLADIRADARGIFVFRNHGQVINVYQLDTSTPAGFVLGTRFMLSPNDVVFVTRSPLGRWNDTISAILPSISVADGVTTLAE